LIVKEEGRFSTCPSNLKNKIYFLTFSYLFFSYTKVMDIRYDQPSTIENSYKSILGQRPLWDWRHSKFYWIDIYEKLLIETDILFEKEKKIFIPEGITNIFLKDTNSFIISSIDSIFDYDLKINRKSLIKKINALDKGNRINDGAIDLEGNLWLSTMNQSQTFSTGEILYYSKRLEEAYSDKSYIISNGPIFDYGRKRGYVTDSIKRIIYYFSTNEENGIQNKKIFLSFSLTDGNPDGMTIDKGGNLWVAMWGTGKVCCFNKDAQLKLILQLPVSKVTSCTFGGLDLNTLYITTASIGLNEVEYERQPHAGKIFTYQTKEEGYRDNCFQLESSRGLLN